MAQAQHTPGPWSFRITGWKTNPAAIYSSRRPGAVACIPSRTSVPLDEQSANASLIAAAPDMLAALEFVLPCLTDINANHPQALSDDELAQIKRTIAKAKGAN